MANEGTLTEVEFGRAQDRVDDMLRGSKRGTPEREAADAVNVEWEKAIALPQATAQQRQDRRIAIAATARRLGLLG